MGKFAIEDNLSKIYILPLRSIIIKIEKSTLKLISQRRNQV